jgi:arylsulfatase
MPRRLPLLAAVPLLLASLAPAAPSAPRPNLVVILADDMGYSDLGAFGGEAETPHLDSLASDGLRFSQFYTTPRCSPTRAALLTGLYSHQAGLGEVPEHGARIGGPGYLAHLNDRCVTLAEVLRTAGYSTYLSGKWHLGRERPHWPVDRGFDRSTALIDCCSNFFGARPPADPADLSKGERYALDDRPWSPPAEGFYSTDWFGENAARMIREHRADRPFFLYLAFTAPHWPLQARLADIAKYRGRFREGWHALRERRFARMRELGLLDPRWQLSPTEGPVPDWETLTAAQREDFDTRMAIYAAMIDVMDRNVGRVLDALKERGFADDTLVLFLSDNGATAENPNTGRPGAALGSAESYHGYGIGWAHLGNTPFRLYKHWVHEGGISTPLLARWPRGIAQPGSTYRHPAHLIDLMPTFVELAGATYPREFKGHAITPPAGTSLGPALRGSTAPLHTGPLFWEHRGNAAVRDGPWKLVLRGDGPAGWELYDMDADRTETRNLAAAHPARVAAMEKQFLAWAARSQVKWPWPLAPYRLEKKAPAKK